MSTFEWDDEKARANSTKHGVSFQTVTAFEFGDAMIVEDVSMDYGESRLVAVGFIGSKVHVFVFVERGEAIRVISLRKADRKEIARYVEYIEKGW